jgi:hypothetical protein
VVGGDQENDFLLLVDLIKESPLGHAIAPSGGLPALQAPDIRAKIGVFALDTRLGS